MMKTIKIQSRLFVILIPVFNTIYGQKLDVSLRYKMDLIAPKLNEVAKPYFTNRSEILKKYGNIGEDGKIKTIPMDDGREQLDITDEGADLLNQLGDTEAEFQIAPLSLEDFQLLLFNLKGFQFLPNEWAMVKLLIDMSETA